ncbi:MAG: ion transporter [Campylobacterota bacterium]|nr:ion transporter [Campylobacterota bacterium]
MHKKVKKFVDSYRFQNFIVAIIFINAIALGLETSKDFMASYASYAETFDHIIVTIFTIEIILRIYVHRISFFKDPWSLFDFFIVAVSLVPASGAFEILRIFRVLRLLRLITVVPSMRKIVLALVNVLPGMGAIAGLLALLFYIFAVMSTNLYGEEFPQWFGTLGSSIYTLFQIMTLESWSMGIVRPVMEVYPNAWIFFVTYITIATFIMINLIIAVVVDAMNDLTQKEESHIVDEIHVKEDETIKEIQKLHAEIEELKVLIKAQ